MTIAQVFTYTRNEINKSSIHRRPQLINGAIFSLRRAGNGSHYISGPNKDLQAASNKHPVGLQIDSRLLLDRDHSLVEPITGPGWSQVSTVTLTKVGVGLTDRMEPILTRADAFSGISGEEADASEAGEQSLALIWFPKAEKIIPLENCELMMPGLILTSPISSWVGHNCESDVLMIQHNQGEVWITDNGGLRTSSRIIKYRFV